jgi:8-oxo-dGTP pyrophosphatase MutT (NUDIX family)
MNELIIAAGGVVWREGKDSKIELAIIHRPKYDDWTFPKGKLDIGEELISGAYREILEETGLDIELGPYLGAVEYESLEKQSTFHIGQRKHFLVQRNFIQIMKQIYWSGTKLILLAKS